MTKEEAIRRIKAWNLDSDDMEVLAVVIPELAESEDERMVRAIEHILYENYSDAAIIEGVEIAEIVAWLEKQKEPVLIPNKFSGLKSLMLQYLQSAANRKDDSEIESDTDLWGRKILDYVWKYSDEYKEPHYTKRNALFDKCVENCDPAVMKKVSDEVDEMLEKEQKPAEWSEEDEDFINMLILHFNYLIDKGGDSVETYKSYIEKLKSLRPQPKQEWTEKEKKMLAVISYKISQHQGNDERSLFTPDEAEFIDGMEDKLKSLRPSWKPSEEQMEALNALNLHGDLSYVGQQNQLISLYQDLKKLM